jgi:ADP-ribose pyrophosphatase YjhB (NUDIX family)
MEKDINLHILFCTAFIRKGNQFLFARRSLKDKQCAGQWASPGGKVDNELEVNIVENTVIREIEEEVGVKVSKKLVFLGSDSFIRSSGHHVVVLTFLAEYLSGKPRPLEDQEDVKWFTIADMLKLIDDDPQMSYLMPKVQMLQNYLNS